MSLRADLDHALQIILEPGFFQHFSAREVGKRFNPTTVADTQAFWRDPASGVICKYPLQLNDNWLNSANQLDSVIGFVERGSGTVQAPPSDVTAQRIFETEVFQNPSQPWISHAPTLDIPFIFDGHGGQANVVAIEETSETGFGLTIAPSAGPPGAASDMKCVVFSKEALPSNQALFFRWLNPPSLIGGQTIYIWMAGQFAYTAHGDLLEVHEDVSPNGDRTQWRRVMTVPLFRNGTITPTSNQGNIGTGSPHDENPRFRSLLVFPYRRQYVFLQSSTGHWAVVSARPLPRLNGKTGTDKDWLITREDKLSVWFKGTGAGLFQIQKVKFFAGNNTFRVPQVVVDYTPTTPITTANVVPEIDKFHGTNVTWGVPTTPPGYNDPTNLLDTCPEPLMPASAQTRTYGFQFGMEASSDQRWTPFFYGFEVRIPQVAGAWPNSPVTVSDKATEGLARISRAWFSSSLKRGESELKIEIDDWPTYPATPRYFTADVPVRLYESVGPSVYFTGITTPNEVHPLRADTGILRRFEVTANDLWKLMSETTLRDQRDWGPRGYDPSVGGPVSYGHLFVVDFIARQAGIDTTGAEYPSGGIGGPYDWKLGFPTATTAAQETGDVQPPWRPKDNPPDTAASYIERVASLFSGWDVGFHPDGQFFYRPKDYYKVPEVTFFKTRGGGSPSYRSPVTFRNEEPEANVVQVEARDAHTGGPIVSSRWVDKASIANPLAPNFIGRWRAAYVKVDGAYSCPELNRIAMILWQAARRRHLLCRFEGDYYKALKVGHVFRLEGYPQLFRLQNYEVELRRVGWQPCQYEAEVVENGAMPA